MLRLLCPALFLVGIGLMIPFETAATLTLGVAALLGFVVCGLFLIATPDFIDQDSADEP